jgi:hypothetical protein
MKNQKTSGSMLLLRGAAQAAIARRGSPALINRLLPVSGMLALAASLHRWRMAASNGQTPEKAIARTQQGHSNPTATSRMTVKQRPPTRRRICPAVRSTKGGAS